MSKVHVYMFKARTRKSLFIIPMIFDKLKHGENTMDDLQKKKDWAEEMEYQLIQANNTIQDCREAAKGISPELVEWLGNTSTRMDKAVRMVQKYIDAHKQEVAAGIEDGVYE